MKYQLIFRDGIDEAHTSTVMGSSVEKFAASNATPVGDADRTTDTSVFIGNVAHW